MVACTKTSALAEVLRTSINDHSTIKLVILDVDLGEDSIKSDEKYLRRLKHRISLIEGSLNHKYKVYAVTQYENDSNAQKTMNWLRQKGIDIFPKSHYFDNKLEIGLNPKHENYLEIIKEREEEQLGKIGILYKNAIAYHKQESQIPNSKKDNLKESKSTLKQEKCENSDSNLIKANEFIKRLNHGSKAFLNKFKDLSSFEPNTIRDKFAREVPTVKSNSDCYKSYTSLAQEVSKHKFCIGHALESTKDLRYDDIKHLERLFEATQVIFPLNRAHWSFEKLNNKKQL